jgi:hypothetical protein
LVETALTELYEDAETAKYRFSSLEESKLLGVEIVDGEEVERSLRSLVGVHVDLSLPSWRLRLGHTQRLNSNLLPPRDHEQNNPRKIFGPEAIFEYVHLQPKLCGTTA